MAAPGSGKGYWFQLLYSRWKDRIFLFLHEGRDCFLLYLTLSLHAYHSVWHILDARKYLFLSQQMLVFHSLISVTYL